MTLPSISLIGVAAFKQLINVGEEVYTINIQPTLHTDEAELFAKVVSEAYQDFFNVLS